MNLFAGLEKFGFSGKEDLNILAEDAPKKKNGTVNQKTEMKALEEKDYVLAKKITCPVCQKTFTTLQAKSKLKRLDPDFDLRPNFEGIDTIKYDVTVCPHCGYGALNKNFEHISPTHIKLVKEQVSSRFCSVKDDEKKEIYTYDEALVRFKLTLVSTIAKRAKLSEKAYVCLNMAWLLRAEIKTMPSETEAQKKQLAGKQAEFEEFYKQAFDGLMKAMETEMPPYCGMDNATIEFMIANMAMYYKKYDVATKLVARLLTAPGVPSRVKDKCMDLKEQILSEVRKKK